MHIASSIFIVTLLCCGSLAGVARRDVSNEVQKTATKSENAASNTKSLVVPNEAALKGEEEREEDTRLELPVRDARAENVSPLIQVTDYVRSMLPRGEVIRPMTRQIMGVVQGREGCWQKTLCQAGSMLAGFRQTPEVFNMIEKYSPNAMKEHFEIMKSSAVDGADCATLICYV